jgi:hypothetical protein
VEFDFAIAVFKTSPAQPLAGAGELKIEVVAPVFAITQESRK